MPLVYEVLVYRQRFGPSVSVLESDLYQTREEAEAFAATQRTEEMRASVVPRCTEKGHPVGRTAEGDYVCLHCQRKEQAPPG